jgi:carboxypeptidase Q
LSGSSISIIKTELILKYNINLRSLICLVIFLFIPGEITSTGAQVKEEYIQTAQDLVRSSLVEQKGYKWLEELCEIGPRLSGSENSVKAIRWAEQKMKDLGFEVWLQPVMVPHWDRGDIEEAAIFKSDLFEGRQLEILALGGSVGTDKEGITAEVIEVNDFDELEQRRNEVTGKIVFFSRPLDAGLLNTFRGYGGAVNQRSRGAIEAAKIRCSRCFDQICYHTL